MNNKCFENSLTQKDTEDSLVDLVTKFLEYTNMLLSEGAISEELYHELRKNKVEFLNYIENK